MKNTIHMFVKELKSYFFSPIAYVTLTLFLLISIAFGCLTRTQP